MVLKLILKLRWLILPLIFIAVFLLQTLSPNYEELVVQKGSPQIPKEYNSQQALEILDRYNEKPANSKEDSLVLVFHDEKGLTDAQLEKISTTVDGLKTNEQLYVTDVQNPIGDDFLESQLLSEDHKTLTVPFSVNVENKKLEDIRNSIDSYLQPIDTEHYITGGSAITEDNNKSTQEGVSKSEWVTILFIVVVLIIVFRSPVAPIVSLLGIGITYLSSLSLIAILGESYNFPLSIITQSFLIMVLFGIGTDYLILLFMRFKEELGHHESTFSAIAATYKTAGKTVYYSAFAVIVGFSTLFLSGFNVFRSAGAVAVAVVILLIVLSTFVPACMAILGQKLFWPIKKVQGHKENKFWHFLGTYAVRKPVLFAVLAVVITLPNAMLYNGKVSYDTLSQVDPSYDSVKGFNILQDAFSPGKAMPATFVLESNHDLSDAQSLAMIDNITEEIANTKGVKQVYSATRPQSEKIKEFYVQNQSQTISNGLEQSIEGISEIQDGLGEASSRLKDENTSSNAQDIDQLLQGTKAINENLDKLSNGLTSIEAGMRKGEAGASQITERMMQLENSSNELSASTLQVLGGYQELYTGLSTISDQYSSTAKSLSATLQLVDAIQSYTDTLAQKYTELQSDSDMQQLNGSIKQLKASLTEISNGLATLNGKYTEALVNLKAANDGLAKIADGQKQISSATAKLAASEKSLEDGLEQGANGQAAVISQIPQLQVGLDQLYNGQQSMKTGIESLTTSLGTLQTGLDDSVDGLNKVNSGLADAKQYLDELGKSDTSAFFAPEEALKNADFKTALNNYLSEDKTIAKWTIILSDNPYSMEAIDTVNQINTNVGYLLEGTEFQSAKYGTAGVSADNAALNQLNKSEFTRTVIFMLIGIGIILVIFFRSILLPIYVIISLVLAYFTSINLTEWIYQFGFGHASGTEWAVPFFSFILLIALGVDYSIFLLMRFREYHNEPPKVAIVKALTHMGSVIMSAVIILIGTFGALYPSNVAVLMQLATVVIIGLIILVLVLLPLFIPSLIALTLRKREANENA